MKELRVCGEDDKLLVFQLIDLKGDDFCFKFDFPTRSTLSKITITEQKKEEKDERKSKTNL